MQPSQNGRNGRGQFAAGNKGGPGNPHARRVHRLRAALLRAATPADFEQIARSLIEKAKTGDIPAIKELFDRTIGKPSQCVEVTANNVPRAFDPSMSREELMRLLEQRADALVRNRN